MEIILIALISGITSFVVTVAVKNYLDSRKHPGRPKPPRQNSGFDIEVDL